MDGRRLHGRRGLKCTGDYAYVAVIGSPPSRAAWIEILYAHKLQSDQWSPPSRAAWIEIR